MSSHHFVTDKQSAVLFVVGRNIEQDLLDQLLEWNPFIVVHSSCVAWFQSMDIKIDSVVGDYSAALELPYSVENWKEEELRNRLSGLMAEGRASRVTIVGPEPGQLTNLWESWMEHQNYPQTVFAGRAKYFPILNRDQLKKWVSEDYRFKLVNPEYAEVIGDVEMVDGETKMRSAGWLLVNALNDVIFVEYE